MKENRIPLENFDLEGFVGKIESYLKVRIWSDLNPFLVMEAMDEINGQPYSAFENAIDLIESLKGGQQLVFFPFADYDEDGTICADGKLYKEGREQEIEDGEVIEETFFVGMEESLGFLVQLEGGDLVFRPAMYICGACIAPPPRVDLVDDCDFLEQPMTRFLEEFVKPNSRAGSTVAL